MTPLRLETARNPQGGDCTEASSSVTVVALGGLLRVSSGTRWGRTRDDRACVIIFLSTCTLRGETSEDEDPILDAIESVRSASYTEHTAGNYISSR